MTNTPQQAIDHCLAQSKNGPRFAAGLCKRQTRLAYAVPSDGSLDATQAWHRTDHRIAAAGAQAPRGALLWWTGGSEGHGHVAIADGQGGVWSVDVKRTGYWDHVPFAAIGQWAPLLHWAGVSRDIEGVTVVPVTPAPEKPAPVPTRPASSTQIRNDWTTERHIDWLRFDTVIGTGERPDAAAAKKARDLIEAAMQAYMKETE